MDEKRTPHLRVVRPAADVDTSPQDPRADYWSQVQALRDERQRLQAG